MSNNILVWRSHPFVVAVQDDTLYRGKFMDENQAKQAVEKLESGESPKEVFGWTRGELKLAAVRSIEWVPDVSTLLIKRHWLRDPWRLPMPEAETAYRSLVKLLPNARETQARLGPNDLAMDPRVAGGVVFAIAGLIALIGGAMEGAGPAPVKGKFIAVIGEQIGVIPAISIGILAVLAGIGSLIWWYVNRPVKHVVRRAG